MEMGRKRRLDRSLDICRSVELLHGIKVFDAKRGKSIIKDCCACCFLNQEVRA